nr:MAG TPA: hypothetical protein [Caudoviricetes sp.]
MAYLMVFLMDMVVLPFKKMGLLRCFQVGGALLHATPHQENIQFLDHLFWLLRLRYSSMYISSFGPKALRRRKPMKPVAAILPVPPPRILAIALTTTIKATKVRMMMSMMIEPKVSIIVSFFRGC